MSVQVELLKSRSLKMVNTMTGIIDDQRAIDDFFERNDLRQPHAKNEEGYKRRLLCGNWWFKSLQRKQDRKIEQFNINLGQVKKGKQVYCSNDSVETVTRRRESSRRILEKKVAVSDHGDEVNMIDILSASISNPTNKLAELMVRMSGFEEYAKNHNHIGEFYTITTPSRFHKYSKGKQNTKYNATPKQAQDYLTKLWSKIRASFARSGIVVYGFRVAEPHHDGCPHWHMLFFMNRQHQQEVREILHDYSCKENEEELHHLNCTCKEKLKNSPDRNNQGSASCDVRFNYKEIDPKIGSATGYIAKYIAKNLGFGIGLDSEDPTKTTCQLSDRVKAWSSTWGIRQFQQIGGASVSVWRELRKLDQESLCDDDLIKQAIKAADESNWSLFLEIMGGADVKRKEQMISLLKKNKVDLETGEVKVNRYQETVTFIFGVSTLANQVLTRFKDWQIFDLNLEGQIIQSQDARSASGSVFFPPWSSVINCTQ